MESSRSSGAPQLKWLAIFKAAADEPNVENVTTINNCQLSFPADDVGFQMHKDVNISQIAQRGGLTHVSIGFQNVFGRAWVAQLLAGEA